MVQNLRGRYTTLALSVTTIVSVVALAWVIRDRLIESRLIGELGAPDEWQRQAAAERLVERRSRRAVPRLLEIVKEEPDFSPWVARALWSLEPWGREAVVALLDDAEESHPMGAVRCLNMLGTEAEAALPALMQILGHEKAEVRELASETLAAMGTTAIPSILSALASNGRTTRISALNALNLFHGRGVLIEKACPLIVALAGDEDPDVRSAALQALTLTKACLKDSLPTIIRNLALASAKPTYLLKFQELIQRLSPEDVVPHFLAAIQSEDNQLSVGALRVLGRTGYTNSSLVAAIVKIVDGDNSDVRAAALATLGEFINVYARRYYRDETRARTESILRTCQETFEKAMVTDDLASRRDASFALQLV